jgi:hypothetical protein
VSDAARMQRGKLPPRHATTDRDGRCEIVGLWTIATFDLRLERSGRILRDQLDFPRLEPGERREIELVVAAGVQVNGRMIDQHGEPVRGASIGIGDSSRDDPPEESLLTRPAAATTTGPDGEFTFADIQPGSWRIASVPPFAGSSEVTWRATPVWIPEGKREIDVTIIAQRGLFIRGRVVRPDGKAASGMRVFAVRDGVAAGGVRVIHETSRQTDTEGRFAFGPLVAGDEFLLATRRPDSPAVRAHAGDDEVVLRPREVARIVGIVVDRRTSKPVDARVLVDCPEADEIVRTHPGSGRFSVEKSVEGSCSLQAWTVRDEIGSVRDLTVRAGEPLEGIEIRVDAGAILELESETDEIRVANASGDIACDLSSISPRCLVEAGPVVLYRRMVTPAPGEEAGAGRDAISYREEARLTLRRGERRTVALRR